MSIMVKLLQEWAYSDHLQAVWDDISGQGFDDVSNDMQKFVKHPARTEGRSSSEVLIVTE